MQEKIASILNSMADGVITLTLTGEIEYMNPAAAHILNCHPKTVLGKHIDRIYRVVTSEEHSPLVSLPHLALSATETPPPPREVFLFNAHSKSTLIQESAMHLKNSKANIRATFIRMLVTSHVNRCNTPFGTKKLLLYNK
ncbi:PAS domain-containing protein [Iodobacter fluviatilis]|nr:PAS domain-containing protein [Iodobacter fluviatilis]